MLIFHKIQLNQKLYKFQQTEVTMDIENKENLDNNHNANVGTNQTTSPMLDISEAISLAKNGEAVLELNHNNYDTANEKELSESEAELLAEEKQNHVAELSPFRIVLKRFMRSKLSIIGVGLLIFLLLFSFVGPIIYQNWKQTEIDYTPGGIDRDIQQIIYIDDEGNEHEIYIVVEKQKDYNYWASPSKSHPFGTDRQGMDTLARLMYGGRVSLLIALSVIIIQTLIGIILGGLAGYFGKWVDMLIMRIVEIFICVPSLPLLIIIGAITSDPNLNMPANTRIIILIAVMTFFGWASIARLVRGQILALREQEYMIAAETMGFGNMRRIFKHLIPNIMPVLLVTMTLGFGQIILAEAGLSFLGFGVPQPQASWGGMLSQMMDPNVRLADYLAKRTLLWILPGLMILLSVLSFNFIGDGLRDAMDPKARR